MTYSLSKFSGQYITGTYASIGGTSTRPFLTCRISGSGQNVGVFMDNNTEIRSTTSSLILNNIYTHSVSCDLSTSEFSLLLFKDGQQTFSKTSSFSTQPMKDQRDFGIGCDGYLVQVSSYEGSFLAGKVYSLQHKSDDILVRNFVPCYRKSDGVIGFYDTIKGEFCINKGKGSLVKGPDM